SNQIRAFGMRCSATALKMLLQSNVIASTAVARSPRASKNSSNVFWLRSLPTHTTRPVVVVGDDGQEPAAAPVGDLVDADAVQLVQPGVVDVLGHDAVTMWSTASQEQRSSLDTAVLSIRCASHAAKSSKSVVCRAPGRTHGTRSVRTRRRAWQSMR